MTNRLEGGRIGLALVAVVGLVLSLFAVFGSSPALAVSPTCATSQNWQSFTFIFENGHVFSGDNCPGSPYAADPDGNSQESFLPLTGGLTSVLDGPGMQLHTSCSDVYEDGWGKPGNQPDPTNDAAWKLASFHIEKFHNDDSSPHATCDQPWTPPTTTTSTTQPTTTTSTTQPTTTTSTTQPTTTTTTEPTTTTSVLGTTITAPPSTLPFTGIESSEMVGIAIMLLGSGILLTMFGLGRREEN